MNDEKLEKEIAALHELAKADKKIDVASLMINALQKHEGNLLPVREKRWAYLISLAVPPFGLLFAVKYYLSDKDDAKETALLCLVLTAVSILLAILFSKALLGGSNTQDIQELIQ